MSRDVITDILIQEKANLRADLDLAEDALRRKGYRKQCDIPACNCGPQWAHGGLAEMRLSEISDALPYANGKTLLDRVQDIVNELEHTRLSDEQQKVANSEIYKQLTASQRKLRIWIRRKMRLEYAYRGHTEEEIQKLMDDSEFPYLSDKVNLPEGCTRSHPHEAMDEACQLKAEIAKLNNENVHEKLAKPETVW